MLSTRLLYLFFFAIVGSYLPYLPLFLHERGLNDWQIGWVMGMPGIAAILAPLIMAHFADRHVKSRLVIGLALAASSVALAGMLLAHGFVAQLVLTTVFSLFHTPLFSLIDGLAISVLEDCTAAGQKTPPFHRLRLWGSLGFVIPMFLLFPLFSIWKLPYSAAMLMAIVFSVLTAAHSFFLPGAGPELRGGKASLPSLAAVRAVLREPLMTFIGSRFVLAAGMVIFYSFFPRYLEELGVAPQFVGSVIALGVAAEIVLLLMADKLYRRFSLPQLIASGTLACMLRFGLLAAFPGIAVAVATQVLHAPMVLTVIIIPPVYLCLKSEKNYRNSILGLNQVLSGGIARIVGPVAGGYAAASATGLPGLQRAMLVAAALALVASIWTIAKFRDNKTRLLPDEEAAV